ncbi:unnamed protein product [Caretta caretta]
MPPLLRVQHPHLRIEHLEEPQLLSGMRVINWNTAAPVRIDSPSCVVSCFSEVTLYTSMDLTFSIQRLQKSNIKVQPREACLKAGLLPYNPDNLCTYLSSN